MIKLQNTIIHCRILWQTDFKIIPVNPSPGIPATCVYINSLPLSMDKTCDLLVNNQVQKGDRMTILMLMFYIYGRFHLAG